LAARPSRITSLAVSARANVKAIQRMLGHAEATMTFDTCAGLSTNTCDGESSLADGMCPDLLNTGGAKGIRTPDLLDANESRYQLRHSP
jgi:hypothetical protein